MSPQLTVIVPVFNGMPYLKEAVESILIQTYKDFDLLVIDDGSTDMSVMEYLSSLSDPRVKIKQQKNEGLCCSLNNAIAEIKTNFIARLDQDDIALPSRLEEQMNFFIKHPTYSCTVSQTSRMGANGQEFGGYQTSFVESFEDYNLQRHGSIVHSTICFVREKFIELGGYRQYLYPSDDLDLLIRFLENGKVAVINKPLIKYRIHSQAATFKNFRRMQMTTNYVLQMYELRKNGKANIPIDKFMNVVNKTTPYKRLKRDLNDTGQLLLRKAGMHLVNDQIIQGVLNLLIAFLFDPRLVLRRLWALRKLRRL